MAKTPKTEMEPEPAPFAADPPHEEPAHPEPVTAEPEPFRVPSRGAQVVVDGEAKTAARGGAGASIEENTNFKKGLEAEGVVADGSTPDGSTLTGTPAPDTVGEPPKPAPEVANTDDKPKDA